MFQVNFKQGSNFPPRNPSSTSIPTTISYFSVCNRISGKARVQFSHRKPENGRNFNLKCHMCVCMGTPNERERDSNCRQSVSQSELDQLDKSVSYVPGGLSYRQCQNCASEQRKLYDKTTMGIHYPVALAITNICIECNFVRVNPFLVTK